LVYLPGITRGWVAVTLLLDTGAMSTCLHPRDAIFTIGIDAQLLSEPQQWPYHQRHGGVGGQEMLYYQVPAYYGFRHDDGRRQVIQAGLDIAQPHDSNQALPSLLGRNVLEHFRVIVDGPARQITLA
jgi:hypothetical protein